MRKKLIYIAMPYTAETPERIARNIENARRFVRENFPSDSEFFPVIPHNAGIGVEGLGGESYWYDATESLMLACSAVVLGPGWRSSRGARNEFEAAQRGGIPVIEAGLYVGGLVERLRAVTEPRKSEQTLEPTHWQRVRDERWQLSERIIKLRSFLGSAAKTSVSSEQIRLLEKQLDVMLEYQNLLDTRLQARTREYRKLGDMTLTAILDNQQLRERVLRRMVPVFHMQLTERCPSVVLPADTRDLAWPLLHAISSVQQLREVSTDTLDAKQLHTECLDYLQGPARSEVLK